MDTKLTGIAYPCKLDVFKKFQLDKYELIQKQLKTDFRRAIIDQMLDNVQDVFDFFQSNVSVYRTGSLFKLFRALDFRMTHFLRNILISSLDEWLSYITAHCSVLPLPHEQLDGLSTLSVSSSSSIKVTELEELEGTVSVGSSSALGKVVNKSSSVKSTSAIARSLLPQKRATEWKFPIESRTPLFSAELRLVEGRVILAPSLEDIEVAFVSGIERIAASARTLTSIDKDMMSLMTLDQHQLLDIGSGTLHLPLNTI